MADMLKDGYAEGGIERAVAKGQGASIGGREPHPLIVCGRLTLCDHHALDHQVDAKKTDL